MQTRSQTRPLRPSQFEALPTEVLLEILGHLPRPQLGVPLAHPSPLLATSFVNRRLRALSQELLFAEVTIGNLHFWLSRFVAAPAKGHVRRLRLEVGGAEAGAVGRALRTLFGEKAERMPCLTEVQLIGSGGERFGGPLELGQGLPGLQAITTLVTPFGMPTSTAAPDEPFLPRLTALTLTGPSWSGPPPAPPRPLAAVTHLYLAQHLLSPPHLRALLRDASALRRTDVLPVHDRFVPYVAHWPRDLAGAAALFAALPALANVATNEEVPGHVLAALPAGMMRLTLAIGKKGTVPALELLEGWVGKGGPGRRLEILGRREHEFQREVVAGSELLRSARAAGCEVVCSPAELPTWV